MEKDVQVQIVRLRNLALGTGLKEKINLGLRKCFQVPGRCDSAHWEVRGSQAPTEGLGNHGNEACRRPSLRRPEEEDPKDGTVKCSSGEGRE